MHNTCCSLFCCALAEAIERSCLFYCTLSNKVKLIFKFFVKWRFMKRTGEWTIVEAYLMMVVCCRGRRLCTECSWLTWKESKESFRIKIELKLKEFLIVKLKMPGKMFNMCRCTFRALVLTENHSEAKVHIFLFQHKSGQIKIAKIHKTCKSQLDSIQLWNQTYQPVHDDHKNIIYDQYISSPKKRRETTCLLLIHVQGSTKIILTYCRETLFFGRMLLLTDVLLFLRFLTCTTVHSYGWQRRRPFATLQYVSAFLQLNKYFYDLSKHI